MISGHNPLAEASHGTAVLGQILMVDNKVGGIGIAPSAKGRVISSMRTPNGGLDRFNALIDAVVFMVCFCPSFHLHNKQRDQSIAATQLLTIP